jgi:hypothetical protein
MQKLVFYTQHVTYTPPSDNIYDTIYYKNDKTFTIEPLETVVVIIQNCGDYWFGQGFSQQLVLKNEKLVHSHNTTPFQLCLYIKNTCPNTIYHVYEHSTLSLLIAQPKLNSTLSHVSIKDLVSCNTNFFKLDTPIECDSTSIDSESTVNDDVHIM